MDARLLQASVWILFFTAVHKAMPACMPKNTCEIWQSNEIKISARWGSTPLRTWISPPYRGFDSRRMQLQHIASWFGDCRKRQRWKCAKAHVKAAKCIFSCGSNASPALPENRYRGLNIRVKSSSFHLNVRPLKYSAAGFVWAIGIVFY